MDMIGGAKELARRIGSRAEIPTLHEIENGEGNGVVHWYCSSEHRARAAEFASYDYGEIAAIDVPRLDVPTDTICEVCEVPL